MVYDSGYEADNDNDNKMRYHEAHEAKNDKERPKEAGWTHMDCEASLYID